MKLKLKIIKDIISIGMSNFMILISASIVVSILNLKLNRYGGDFAIGAFGIINSIANLSAMIVIGFCQGMQPIVGYNFGARQISRVVKAFKLTIIAGTSVTTFGFVLCEIFPHLITSAFTTDKQLIEMSAVGLRITLIMFPIVGFQIVTSSFFQSIGRAKISIFLSLSRQVLFLIPAIMILPHFMKLNGVWISIPVADFISSLLSLIVLWWQMKRIKRGDFFLTKA